ncbi:DUF4157 domain-containing protein [Massilia sp. P8910]|uniref:eCIS core domain-containing protein n=1 Tax=Massilia antarctica TaxID=2765360 RepID=UPI001E464AD5|nr:DUF4157 domain-containing protein [Massilia antarctica]MCE3607271.1 DUF4157 domain-containing protein [Massilia antarctica]
MQTQMPASSEQEKKQQASAASQAAPLVGAPPASFEDKRPQAVAQRCLQAMIDRSSRVQRMRAMAAPANPQASVSTPAQLKEVPAPNTNGTGLPERLKSGVESLSGMSMDHVKVHYNSSKPAQLHAHAYAQGSDIHVAPGQERHLPHEAWHVVQQQQGRVQATAQYAGAPVNDNPGLESEADRMGAMANNLGDAMTPAQLSTPARQAGHVGISQQQPVQRRVGFEFQTNIRLKDKNDETPPFKTALLTRDNWHIECDAGDLEFVTKPLNDYDDVNQVLGEIVHWATMLSQIEGKVSDEQRERLGFLLESKYEDEVEDGKEQLKASEARPLAAMAVNKGSLLESMSATGDAGLITAAPQTTIGIPLDRIISALHLVASQQITVGANTGAAKQVKLASAQNGAEPPLVSAHHATVKLVAGLREARPLIKDESTWRKLEGIIALAASYIRTANVAGRGGYGYTKMVAPMMSRVNFSALLAELPEEVQVFFNTSNVAAASGIGEDAPMFGHKGAKVEFGKTTLGPTLRVWVDSIRAGHDALSILGLKHGVGTEAFIKDSESMGQFNELDQEDPNVEVPLVPIELRQISKAVPVSHWHDLAIEIMIFANALLKAKFF